MSVVIAWAFLIMATLLAILIGGFRFALHAGPPRRTGPSNRPTRRGPDPFRSRPRP